jgi:ATP-dependent Lhr-like helicase
MTTMTAAQTMLDLDGDPLPHAFRPWFDKRGWAPHVHQLEMIEVARHGHPALLVAPTGAGKTLAGFLPSIDGLLRAAHDGLHTLYISPLKALTVDVHRNLLQPIEELGLDITVETRTGDTPQGKRTRQRIAPPNMLLTTPESLALLLSYHDAPDIFGNLKRVVIDELHALIGTKRGDLLSLNLARLSALAPQVVRAGLSATVADPAAVAAYLSRFGTADDVRIVRGPPGPKPEIDILDTAGRLPWRGHMALHALPEVYNLIKRHGTTLVFVNTRAQAELVFQGLWQLNDETLPIAVHHGSLEREQRRKVEAAMARGDLRAVVATSSLDLGIDWASIDLVVQMGAPKGSSRLIQRIGRANHRLDEPSRAVLVPGNRFEVLECQAASDAVHAQSFDEGPPPPGALDVLAQHILGTGCSGAFDADALYAEIVTAPPYRDLSRKDFDDALDFVATGGYALHAYERYRRLKKLKDGSWKVTNALHIRRYRMNVGTIVQEPMLKVKIGRGKVLGEVEEYFAQSLVAGDTFSFAGQLLEFVQIRDMAIECRRAASGRDPMVPVYGGGRLPISTHLAERVRGLLADRSAWPRFPEPVREWLALQDERSVVPSPDSLVIESFPREGKEYTVVYSFEGRNAHQTLGMLLTRRMERLRLSPLGFVASDYVVAMWSLRPVEDPAALFTMDLLGDELEDWLAESSMMRRTFRNVAIIAGLIERRMPGQEKTGRQMTFNSDLIYDVLRRYDADHILLRATRRDAQANLIDFQRLYSMLVRIKGNIVHRRLDKVSPLAVPALLEIGREAVYGEALDELLDEATQALVAEATR